MSYNDTVLAACKQLQTPINNAWETGDLNIDNMQLLMYLTEFNQPMRPIISPSNGKVRSIEVTGFQRRPESDVTETSTRTCTATRAPAQFTAEYEIDPNDILSTDTLITARQLQEWCGSNPELFQGEIMRMMDVLRKAVATRIAEQVAVMAGNYGSEVTVSGDNAFEIDLFSSTGALLPGVAEEVDFTLVEQTGFNLPYAIVGGRDWYKYYRLVQEGCCTNDGLDIRAIFNQYGVATMYDRRLKTALEGTGANALAIRQGAVQILNYVEADWTNGTPAMSPFAGANYVSQVVLDPVTGLFMELRISDNCGEVSLVMDTVVKAVSLPSNMFAAGDDLFGVNFITKLNGETQV